jgi:hypothetical protein
MGGSTVFGYEKDNGTVVYIITHGIGIEEIYESKYISDRIVPAHASKSHYCDIGCFFSDEYFENEDSGWRILYKLDGTTVLRRYGDKQYEFLFRPAAKIETAHLCQYVTS